MAAWSSLAANQIPNYQDLVDAVNSGDLACEPGNDCTNLGYDNTRTLSWTALAVDFAFDGTQPSNNLVPSKQDIDADKVLCPEPDTVKPASPSASACDQNEECGDPATDCCYITLLWSNPAGSAECWNVEIWRDTDSGFGSPSLVATVAIGTIGGNQSYDDGFCDDLLGGETYYYQLNYTDDTGTGDGDRTSTFNETMHTCGPA